MNKHIAMALAAGALIAAPLVLALELTPDEQAGCDKQGGCSVVSKAAIEDMVAKAYQAGQERGRISCANRT